MITDGNKCHYLAVSNLSALLSRKSSNHNGDLYCFGYFKNMKKYVIRTTASV